MPSTSIKVPVELRDRLSALARRRHATLAATINHALDIAEAEEFWQQVRDTMPAGPAVDQGESDRALSDGLDSDEDWSDVF